jgi:hypothetical protein
MTGEFTKPEPNLIESTAGYSVRVLGRTGIRYVEGDRSAFIDSEVSGVGRGMAIWSDSLRAWEAPCENDSINEEERHRIISRVARALEFDGATVKVLT